MIDESRNTADKLVTLLKGKGDYLSLAAAQEIETLRSMIHWRFENFFRHQQAFSGPEKHIYSWYRAGITAKALAAQFDYTETRVRQIFANVRDKLNKAHDLGKNT
jgi:AraC-like DNA-binding protein